MKTKQAIALITLFFLVGLGIGYAYGEEKEYVKVRYPGCSMPVETCTMPNHNPIQEKKEEAWVVSPRVVITMPDTATELWINYPGEINETVVYAYRNHLKFRIKAYISGRDLEVSKNIPEEIMKCYEILLPHIEEAGGVLNLADDLKRKHGVNEVGA